MASSERRFLTIAAACASLALAACGHSRVALPPPRAHTDSSTTSTPSAGAAAPATRTTATPTNRARPVARLIPLPRPAPLRRFGAGGRATWHGAGRRVDHTTAVYEATLVPPGGARPAALAWMDTRLLAARLYSGSASPGGGPYRYTAPVARGAARQLVVAFNGGFKMPAAQGGYYTEGHVIDRLRSGAASLVIYRGGSVDIGTWGRDVHMSASVVAVRQNLVPLVLGGRPTPRARSADWQAWGSTCGASSCASSVPGIEHQWRSGLGVTADGALVYVQGAGLDPLQLAFLLARAGVVRGMELDINPDWPVFAAYDPGPSGGLAAPSNGRLLSSTVRGPDTFFTPSWARDFVTMSAR